MYKKVQLEKMQWHIENLLMIVRIHFKMKQILALNNPKAVDVPLNK